MSGSMAYWLDPETNQFHVSGFLNAEGDGGLRDGFYASRADCLREDGTIRRG